MQLRIILISVMVPSMSGNQASSPVLSCVAARRRTGQSPQALAIVLALHAAVIGALLHYQPRLSAATAEILHVSMITVPQPLPVAQPSAPPPPVKPVRKVDKVLTPPPPLETPSAAAINLPPVPPASVALPDPVTAVASAPVAPVPAAPLVLPRFDAAYLQNPPPVYPTLSRRHGEQGRVMLRVVVNPDGTPQSVELRTSSGAQRLDEAALDAVRRWRFVPARQGTTPVTAAVLVPIVFSLEG
jgi:protein TonB